MARSAAIEEPAEEVGRSRPAVIAAAAAFAALALSVGAPPASAAQSPPRHEPTLLWKSFPLVQRPAASHGGSKALADASGAELLLQADSGGSGMPSQTLLLLLVGSLAAAGAGIVMVRSALAGTTTGDPAVSGKRREPADLLAALDPRRRLRQRPPLESPAPAAVEATAVQVRHPPEPAREPEAPAPPAGEDLEVESCKVVLWHGYLKYQLYAASLAGHASRRPLAVSPYFRLRDVKEPNDQAVQALKALVAELGREGWHRVAEGPGWYDVTLERELSPTDS